MRLMEKSPDARYATAEEVIAAIDAAMEGTSPTPPPVTMSGREAVFPGPSIPPPPGGAFTSSPTPISIAPAPVPAVEPTPTPAPAPAAVSTPPPRVEAEPPPAPAERPRRLWAYGIGIGAVAVVAVLVGWPSIGDHAGDAPALPPTSAPFATAPPPPPPPVAPPSAPTAAAKPAPTGPYDGAASRATLRRAVPQRDFPHAAEAFFALADHEPAAFAEPLLLAPTRDLAAAVALSGSADADRVFAALAHRLGAAGPDVLYELVRTRGGSKAAARAEALLAEDEVAALATPALRITFGLRQAPCPAKAALLDRAAAEGDARTLVVMDTTAAACLGRSKALGDARAALKARLRGR
jgi:eukaryotic-like serine/threonine-protein kinase